MLASSAPTLAANCQGSNTSVETSLDQSPYSSKTFPLLQLPIELRNKIFELVLPHTIDAGTRGIAWVRGHCAILATSSRVFDEGIRIMYGRNTFVIDVVWDRVTFAYQWFLPTGLIPRRTFAFPDKLAKSNVSYIRKLNVRIHHVDNYTGMIKHNFSGPGLRQGLKLQVQRLCQDTLQDMYEISHLHIHFQNDGHKESVDQQILEPLMQLTKTRTLQLTGSITRRMERALHVRLSDAYSRNSIFCLPLEIREHIYDLVLPHAKACLNEMPCQLVVRGKGSTEILRTCAMVHKEASDVLYRSQDFVLFPFRGKDLRYRFRWCSYPKYPQWPRFPQDLGARNVLKVKHCVLHWSTQSPCVSEKEQIDMLEAITDLIRCSPNIAHLSFKCFYGDEFRPLFEELRQKMLRVCGAIKVDVFGSGWIILG